MLIKHLVKFNISATVWYLRLKIFKLKRIKYNLQSESHYNMCNIHLSEKYPCGLFIGTERTLATDFLTKSLHVLEGLLIL